MKSLCFTELFAKYSCTNCQEDIIGVRVHCADCVDFELCPQVSKLGGVINCFLISLFFLLYGCVCVVLYVH